jgi:quinol monooxygenase YgiN
VCRALAETLQRLEKTLKETERKAEGSAGVSSAVAEGHAADAASGVAAAPTANTTTTTPFAGIVHLHVHATVADGMTAQFVECTTQNAKASLAEDGVVDFLLLQHREIPERIVILESYQGDAGVAAHGETDHCNLWRVGTKPLCARSKAQWKAVHPESSDRLLPADVAVGACVALVVDVSIRPANLPAAVAALATLAAASKPEDGVHCRMLQQDEAFGGQKEALRLVCVYTSEAAMERHTALVKSFLDGLKDMILGEPSKSIFNVLP